jgi:hypothetical protein
VVGSQIFANACSCWLFLHHDSFDSKVNAYLPHNKEWIKQRVLSHLKQQAGQ